MAASDNRFDDESRAMEPEMKKAMTAVAVALLPLVGCADMTPGQQRALTGTAIGTAGGAAIGALAGNAGLGAGIGAGAGLAGGLLTNAWRNNQERSFQQGFAAGQQSR
jgi:hypothetical protein